MSDTGNVIDFPTRKSLLDDNHARLRRFFDLVAEAADESGIIAYTISALHQPDETKTTGCIHSDVRGMEDSVDGEWVDDTLECMSESMDAVWTVLQDAVRKNIEEHEASDAAKDERDES